MLIYGMPGIGKSSFGFTAESPLLLDFDGGAHRSAFRQDIVPVGAWSEIATITAEDLKPYKTVVLDTVGRALDFLSAELIAENPKLATKAGALSLQGYGALKSAFASWLGRLNSLGLDVIMIAHDKESTNERDVKIVRPDVTGGSYNEIFKLADSVGYMYADGKKRVLDFNPTENYVGKNPAQFDVIEIPDYNREPRFAGRLIVEIKSALGQLSAEAQKVVTAVNAFRDRMPEIETAEEMTALLAEVDKLEEPVKAQCKRVMLDRCNELGLEYDKK
ncbi:MAG TPA: ATP-binding protein, partial [Trueperaceae bacterium]